MVNKYKPPYEIFNDKNFANTITWLLIGLLFFVTAESIIILKADNNYLISMSLMIIGIFLWPIFYIKKSNEFYQVFYELKDEICDIYNIGKEDIENVYQDNSKKIFSLRTRTMLFWGIIVIIGGIVTLYFLMNDVKPFVDTNLNQLVYIGFIPILMVSSISLNIITNSVNFLRIVAHKNINIQSIKLRYPNKILARLKKYYYEFSITISIIYLGLVVIVRNSPYSGHLLVNIWLIVIAFFPLLMFITSYLYINKIIYSIKEKQIEYIESMLNKRMILLEDEDTSDDFEILNSYIELRNKIIEAKVDIANTNAVFSLVISLVSILLQIVSTI